MSIIQCVCACLALEEHIVMLMIGESFYVHTNALLETFLSKKPLILC